VKREAKGKLMGKKRGKKLLKEMFTEWVFRRGQRESMRRVYLRNGYTQKRKARENLRKGLQ